MGLAQSEVHIVYHVVHGMKNANLVSLHTNTNIAL